MSASLNIPVQPGRITVEEFERMDLPASCEWELIDGTVVSLTAPDLDHIDLQDRVAEVLKAQLRPNRVLPSP
ncbi:MAG: hypothetical protein ACRD7E_12685 [Bryobacteraceae bacterium]